MSGENGTGGADWATGRVAFVTGATSGFGGAFARRILGAGGSVIAVGRRQERLSALVAEMKTDRLHAAALDVTDHAALDAVLAKLPPAFQAIDVLFNNAGLALGLGKAQETKWDDWETMIATNVTALARVTRVILPGMVERNRGHIINLGSVAATYPYPGGNVYGATKAFVRQFSLNLRADLLGTAIRVTALEPGLSETEFSKVRFAGDEAAAAKVYAGATPLSADDVVDVAEAVLRLPAHINVNAVEVMPVGQAFSGFAIARSGQ